MENFSKDHAKAFFDHKRFPTVWQAIIGCTFMQFTVIVPILLLPIILGNNYGRLFNSEFGISMFNGLLSQFFAVLIIPLLFILIFKKDMKTTLRLKKRVDLSQAGLLILISLGSFFVVQFINAFFVEGLSLFMGAPADTAAVPDANNIYQLLFELIVVALLPAICEEIFFRGFVMRAFERYSKVSAVLLSSVAFAVMHGNLQQLLYAFILGIILGTVVMITDSLLASSIIHFTLNALSVILSYAPINSAYIFFADNYLSLYAILAFAILPAIAIVAFTIFTIYSRKKNKKQYNIAIVSDMDHAILMPKQQSWETALTVLGWVIFCVINFLSMVSLWYYN